MLIYWKKMSHLMKLVKAVVWVNSLANHYKYLVAKIQPSESPGLIKVCTLLLLRKEKLFKLLIQLNIFQL